MWTVHPSGALFNPEVNPNSNNIPVVLYQADGYTSVDSWAAYNGTIKVGVSRRLVGK